MCVCVCVCVRVSVYISRSSKKVTLIQKVKIELGDFQKFLNNVSHNTCTFYYILTIIILYILYLFSVVL